MNIPKKLYHATRKSSLEGIFKDGLDPKFMGSIHGKMEMQPQEPVVYLSSNIRSNNLNSNLFNDEENDPIVILEIDSSYLNPDFFYPDDCLFYMFAEEDVFTDSDEVKEVLGFPDEESQQLFEEMESATNHEIAKIMKPFWNWYLLKEGEVSYSSIIPPEAIFGYRFFNDPEGSLIKTRKFRELNRLGF